METTSVEYEIAFRLENGAFEVVETFCAKTDADAEAYAEETYPGTDWYVLRDGENINS